MTNAPHPRVGLLALLLLGCLLFNVACAEDPFGPPLQAPHGFRGQDSSLTDPNATPPPATPSPDAAR